jgi:hypothetical protein
MAIKSIRDLPAHKRPTQRQAETAKQAKPITMRTKDLGVKFGLKKVDLGTHDKKDIAGVVKGFRKNKNVDFGVALMDENNNVIARTFVAKARTGLAEQQTVKALAKYAKTLSQVRVIAMIPMKQFDKPKRSKRR